MIHGKVKGLTIYYPSGLECTLTREELQRLRAVAKRPRSPWERPQGPRSLPLLWKDFTHTQKSLFADVAGDTAAVNRFGDGPWTWKERCVKIMSRLRGVKS